MERVIYIAGSYRAETEVEVDNNIQHAKQAMVKLLQEGWVVICSHTQTAHLGGCVPDTRILEACLELVKRSDAIYMLSNWMSSKGSQEEYILAVSLGKEVYYEVNGN